MLKEFETKPAARDNFIKRQMPLTQVFTRDGIKHG